MEYSRVVAIFVMFLCVTLAWQERAEGVCVLASSFVARRGALFTESSSLFLIWHSQWLQAKEPVGHMAVGVAHGVGGTHGCQCGLWRLVGQPKATGVAHGMGGTRGRQSGPWLSVGPPVADSTAHGRQCGLRPSVGPVECGMARGCRWHLWWSVGLEVLAGARSVGHGPRPAGRPWAARRPVPSARCPCLLPPGAPAVEIFQLCFRKCPSRLLCSPRDGGSIEARDKCLHTDPPLATVSVCRGLWAAAHLLAPAPPRESAFL